MAITLAQIAKSDAVIARVAISNLEHVARTLEVTVARLKNPILRYLLCSAEDRANRVTIEMLAATFARVRGVPEPQPPQFSEQVRIAMGVSHD